MKKVMVLLLCVILAMPAIALAQQEQVVNVFTWETYISDDVIAGFEQATGIKVNYFPLGSNEEMLSRLQMNGGSEYDVILGGDYVLNILRKDGLLQELNKDLLPNFGNINPAYQGNYYDPDNAYTVPYTAGTPLIVYDPAMVDIEITGYEDLWDESLADSVSIIDDARIIMGITLKTLGYSLNETDPEILAEAKEKLMPLYSNIRTFAYDNAHTPLLTGESYVGFMFTPFVQLVLDERPDMVVVQPKEGMGFGIDSLAIPVNAPHSDNAHALINYLLDGEVAAQTAMEQYYQNPNQAAEAYLPEDFASSPAYVNDTAIADMEFILDLGETESLYQEIWTEFKNQ